MRKLRRLCDVVGEHGGCEAVKGVVRLPQDILLVFELDDDANRPEYLFLDDTHVWAGVREDGRFDPIALSPVALTAEVHRRAIFLARIDVIHDSLVKTVSIQERPRDGHNARRIGSERLGDPDKSHWRKDRQV